MSENKQMGRKEKDQISSTPRKRKNVELYYCTLENPCRGGPSFTLIRAQSSEVQNNPTTGCELTPNPQRFHLYHCLLSTLFLNVNCGVIKTDKDVKLILSGTFFMK